MRCCNPVTHRIKCKGGSYRVVTHGCGKCDACLKKRQRDWIFRCSWEARKQPYNWIVTLTYSDEWLTFTKKGNATLNKRDFQLFMKRLRKACPDSRLRYLVRGEYGGMFGRPHFHMILFGLKAYSTEEVGFRISDVWPYGGVYVDTYSDRAVNYVTSYILKADDLSQYEDDEIVLPYINVSKRPMIGENFLQSETAQRAIRKNDYSVLGENDTLNGIPRRFAEKMDEMAIADSEYPYFERKARKDSRLVVYDDKNIVHYSDDYLIRKQVDRAQAIQLLRTKEYIRNKAKK